MTRFERKATRTARVRPTPGVGDLCVIFEAGDQYQAWVAVPQLAAGFPSVDFEGGGNHLLAFMPDYCGRAEPGPPRPRGGPPDPRPGSTLHRAGAAETPGPTTTGSPARVIPYPRRPGRRSVEGIAERRWSDGEFL